MYLLYVDESGDTGMVGTPTRYSALSGLIIHELRWNQMLENVLTFRRTLRETYGLRLREEIHAGHFLHKPKKVARIPKHRRLLLLRDVLDFQATLPDVSVLNVLVDKQQKPQTYDAFDKAWTALVQRFENTISRRNFPGPQNPEDYGLIVVDRTDEKKLRNLVRRMRRYNPVPSMSGVGYRQIPIRTIVEDPVHRNSLHSLFIQLADVNAYFLFQKHQPCGYVRKKGARNWFDRLDPVLCKVASHSDPQGVVRL